MQELIKSPAKSSHIIYANHLGGLGKLVPTVAAVHSGFGVNGHFSGKELLGMCPKDILLSQETIRHLRGVFRNHGQTFAVLELTGTEDGAVSAGVSAEVLGPKKVWGVILAPQKEPEYSQAKTDAKTLGIRCCECDTQPVYDALVGCIQEGIGLLVPDKIARRIKARIRMAVLEIIAEMLLEFIPTVRDGVVVGNDEDGETKVLNISGPETLEPACQEPPASWGSSIVPTPDGAAGRVPLSAAMARKTANPGKLPLSENSVRRSR